MADSATGLVNVTAVEDEINPAVPAPSLLNKGTPVLDNGNGNDDSFTSSDCNREGDTDISENNEDKHAYVEHLSKRTVTLYLEGLPVHILKKVRALKNNQLELNKISVKYYEEAHQLEYKYSILMKKHFDMRRAIVTGLYEPTNEDCDLGDFNVDPNIQSGSIVNESIGAEQDHNGEEKPAVVGIPDFWMNVFQTAETLSMLCDEPDYDILKHLVDIEIEVMNDPMVYKLHFCFSPNEYFSNNVLTKTYDMKCDLDADNPLSFEGVQIIKATGCTIDWNDGKDVTVKTIIKTQVHKKSGAVRTITKTIPVQSFFNFFNPPVVTEDLMGDELEENKEALASDLEVGLYIREQIIPRAVLFFTGEALDLDDSDYTDEEDDSYELDSSDDNGKEEC